MRLRNVKGAKEALIESDFTVNEPGQAKGRWKDIFGNDREIHLEIGTGKGRFIMELAEQNPHINYIGIEKFSSVLIRAVEKQRELALPNLRFIRMDAEKLEDVFDKDEISRIYLNFSDPWPKDRHAKRRLTSRQFFERYSHVLIPDGRVEFKTDNEMLFEFSLNEVEAAGWQLVSVTNDLHKSDMNKDNIMTEYEIKFSKLGSRIHKLVAVRREVDLRL